MISKRLYDSIERRIDRGEKGRCVVCEGRVSPSARGLAARCASARCRSLLERFEERREHLQQRRRNRPGGPAERELRERLEAERDRIAGESRETVEVAVVPTHPLRLVPLPDARQRSFRDHLDQLIAKIAGASDTDDLPSSAGPYEELEPAPALEPLLGSLCGMCRGQCCTTASSHAYLNEADVVRVLQQSPGTTPEALARRYAAHFPQESYEGSCVFHGAAGCTLPSRLRSDMCNRFLCRGLTRLGHELRSTTRSVLAVAVADCEVVRRARIECPEPNEHPGGGDAERRESAPDGAP